MNRLHEKGLISNPVGKAKSVVMTEEGFQMAEKLFRKHFVNGNVATMRYIVKTLSY
jgi:Mn-dependent DtxR family transcriptional regulator